jgi:hypothetical protein
MVVGQRQRGRAGVSKWLRLPCAAAPSNATRYWLERSPLFCATCDVDLTLDDVVFALGVGTARLPEFIHVECGPPRLRAMRRSRRRGPGRVRRFVLEHLREQVRRRRHVSSRSA